MATPSGETVTNGVVMEMRQRVERVFNIDFRSDRGNLGESSGPWKHRPKCVNACCREIAFMGKSVAGVYECWLPTQRMVWYDEFTKHPLICCKSAERFSREKQHTSGNTVLAPVHIELRRGKGNGVSG